jgi:hypothetical protein
LQNSKAASARRRQAQTAGAAIIFHESSIYHLTFLIISHFSFKKVTVALLFKGTSDAGVPKSQMKNNEKCQMIYDQ